MTFALRNLPRQDEHDDQRVDRERFDQRAAGHHVDKNFPGRFRLTGRGFHGAGNGFAETESRAECRDAQRQR